METERMHDARKRWNDTIAMRVAKWFYAVEYERQIDRERQLGRTIGAAYTLQIAFSMEKPYAQDEQKKIVEFFCSFRKELHQMQRGIFVSPPFYRSFMPFIYGRCEYVP